MDVQLSFEDASAPVNTEDQRKALLRAAQRRVRSIGEKLLTFRDSASGSSAELAAIGADLCTSLADARAAVNIAAGLPMEDIDPASGQEYSKRIYLGLRKSWQRSYDRTISRSIGWNLDELRQVAEKARQDFIAKRPGLDDGEPWIKG
ncbi:hypothetical protein [Streptomyces sp. NPDC059701]|uniref:hypothetical protein n=1 Tax=Streptomyces sp. NPDC059701 TaxID=3346914 RepID=UPI0036B04906